jgi:adenine/guanine phosphoribosyltransferase-like PRPP-binding protein
LNTDGADIVAVATRLAPGISVDSTVPEVTEALGIRMARQFADSAIDQVVAWDTVAAGVLAHVVARELSAQLVLAYADEGLLGVTIPSGSGHRIVLVGYAWQEYPGIEALIRMLESSGATIVGIASVLAPPASASFGEIPALVLESIDA